MSSRVTDRERRIIELSYANNMGHIADADKLFRLYLSDYPDDWTEHYDYANLLRKRGREIEAISQYEELLRIAPEDANVHVQIATAYKTLDKPADAIGAYSEAFRLDPAILNVSNINREYGFALIANGEHERAGKVFSDFASQPSKRSTGLDSLALLDLMYGKYATAHERLEEALSLAEQTRDPFLTARTHFLLAVVAKGERNRSKQTTELDTALSDFSNWGQRWSMGHWWAKSTRVKAQ